MPLLIVFTLLLFLRIPACSAVTDTILVGQALAVNDKLVSKNGRYALGFFETSGIKSSQGTINWYLGIWFNTVPKFTSAWVANRDKPIKTTTSLELTISHDGNLVIQNSSTKSIIWSTQANITRNSTTAMLLSSGNFILTDSSNSSEVLWQSFDHPTDTFFPGAKLGLDKVTGLNRRIVSSKNLINLASGMYCTELDPSGVNQFLLVSLNSSVRYWSSGVWNGKYFTSIPEMQAGYIFTSTFVSNDQEKYYTYNLQDEDMVTRQVQDVSGRSKLFIWLNGSQDWVMIYAQPKDQCDVHAVCGPFTICRDNTLQYCKCMEGFTITSPEDWELEDRTGGCSRNTPIDCISNKSTTLTTDRFYFVPCVKLLQNAPKVEGAPEWITGVAITPKVDVYSYGMVLLEIISRKRNSSAPCSGGGNFDGYFPVYAAHKLLEGGVGSLVDHRLHGNVNLDEAELACKVACWCIQDDELDRPTMGEVVQILEGLVEIRMPPIPRLLEAMAGSSHSTSS